MAAPRHCDVPKAFQSATARMARSIWDADTCTLAAASVTTEASSADSSLKDLQKWSLPTVRAEDIEICRRPDGSPIKLGRGGFCKVDPMPCTCIVLPLGRALRYFTNALSQGLSPDVVCQCFLVEARMDPLPASLSFVT